MSKIQDLPPDSLKPYKKNARVHSVKQIEQIAASIQEFGFTSPVIIDENKNVIAGHGRLEAAKVLNMESVPCVEVRGLTKTQRRKLVIADNKIAENATWDWDVLKSELIDLGDFKNTGMTKYDYDWIVSKDQFYSSVKEYSEKDFSEFKHKCPRCKFEFD